ncbi:MAG: Mur ligase family protein [Oscillospiraceae bacterium]|nr:Mur ligase family protein [Oscillospiraceae bacterium]
MLQQLRDFFANKRVLILGFGLEGKSTLKLLEQLDCGASVEVREKYHFSELPLPDDYDIIMKSPGIPLFQQRGKFDPRITGQADLFLRFCENRTIGITGTKGKSTTSSLIHHILCKCGRKSRLIGNIGVPPLDIVWDLAQDSKKHEIIVAELSCHQLEYCKASPNVAVFLNLFEEHLDHYIDFAHYRAAKENIFKFQGKFQREGDVLIRGEDVDASAVDSTKARLRGVHNLHNIAIGVRAAVAVGVLEPDALTAAYTFSGLEHRLEAFEVGGVTYVNDSISTIPAAAIAAVAAFPECDTLIIGGMDRGIDYSELIAFLNSRTDISVIALPDTGHKIADALAAPATVHKSANLEAAAALARRITKRCCVLSPAAASYGFYTNFEERGRHFKELVIERA